MINSIFFTIYGIIGQKTHNSSSTDDDKYVVPTFHETHDVQHPLFVFFFKVNQPIYQCYIFKSAGSRENHVQ